MPKLTKFVPAIFAGAIFLLLSVPPSVRGGEADSQFETPSDILKRMESAADWQLKHPSEHSATDWTQATFYAGMMALAGISSDPDYAQAMVRMGETNFWKPGPGTYNADDLCVAQTYAELYLRYRDLRMIQPTKARLDHIFGRPPTGSLLFTNKEAWDQWSWCDSLFMAPPTWVRFYAATGDQRYLDYAVTNWWRTYDFLYSAADHLYFRDSTFFAKREANRQKVFWSRGNGWVMGGLVRLLQYLPGNHPDHPRFVNLFREMAEKILTCQQDDGLWRASLLDPENYPEKEASGSSLYAYALAWGINQGILDRPRFEPAVWKAWRAIASCVEPDGKLTRVQPIGLDPKRFNPGATEIFGVGSFLLAGSEVYRLSVLEHTSPRVVHVCNPAGFWRENETVELDLPGTLAVMDGSSSRILDSQSYRAPDGSNRFIFQVDLAPHETRTYDLLDLTALAGVPSPVVKTYARAAPERHDDFAWESDRIAHRMFGKGLETYAEEPLTSSGVDVWIKRTRNLVINEMYRTGDFFNPAKLAQDDYRVGKTRGDGGLGIWADGKLYVSKNWSRCRVITTGPIRSEFELTYDAWNAGGRDVSELKRIRIDAGANMSRVETLLNSPDSSSLQIGIGLAERPGDNLVVSNNSPVIETWQSSTRRGLIVQDQAEGWMTYWQPQDFAKGTTAVAVVLPGHALESFANDHPDLPASAFASPSHTVTEGAPALRNLLAVTRAEPEKPLVYYVGAGWSQSGDFPNAATWSHYISRFAERLAAPLQVSLQPESGK